MAEKRSHFVGIGGSGMSGIAQFLLSEGYPITGSDVSESAAVKSLRNAGAQIFLGHSPDNLANCDEIVTSTAIRPDNPEVVEALRRGIPVIHRSKKLAQLVNERRGITVAGTHGKTTTSGMIATMLNHAGHAPSFVIGGKLNTFENSAQRGETEWMVIEADESDGSLIEYHAEVAILTNIELDHLDYYRDTTHLHEVFAQYVANVKPEGVAIYCSDDPGAQRLVGHGVAEGCLTLAYGMKEGADIFAVNPKFSGLGSTFAVHSTNLGHLGDISLQIPGTHNICNSLAAVGVGLHLGLDWEQIRAGLYEFLGVERRFQIVGKNDSYTIVTDYAHHPTEVKATLSAARQAHDHRIVAIFQPHRYSRTQSMMTAFGEAFALADEVIITDIYAAGESPVENVTGERLAEEIRTTNHPSVHMVSGLDNVEEFVAGRIQENDLILALGAGDIWKVARNLSDRLTPQLA